jgi:hypothetical protein
MAEERRSAMTSVPSAGPGPSPPEGEARATAPWRDWLLLAAPTLAGAVLRLWGIERQVLADDELHALQFAAEHSLGTILTSTSPEVDHSVPLTALVRLALDGGLEPSELLLRAPVLLAGVALVPVLALGVRRAVGARIACAFAWLLAISPLLVLYGRLLRSYGPVLLLALAAVLAFHRWLERGRRADALLYAFLAPLAAWFHLVSAVFVAAPLAWGALMARRRRGGPRWREVAVLGAGTGLFAAALFAPLAASLASFVGAKSGAGTWQWQALRGTLQLQAGVVSPVAAVLFFAVCALGAVRLARLRPGLCAYLGFLSVAHVAAVLAARPAKLENVLVLDRYLVLLLPILLLFAASAFGSDGSRGGRALIGHGCLAAFLALLFLDGPLTRWQYLHGSFAHHDRFLAFFRARSDAPPAGRESPASYARLAADESARAIVECPVDHRWSRSNAPYYDQRVHGKEVVVSSDLALHADPRFRWRNAVAARPAAFLASRADYLVLHLDPGAEERPLSGAFDERAWREVSSRARALRLDLVERWGTPAFADERVAVWDLRAIRAEAAAGR